MPIGDMLCGCCLILRSMSYRLLVHIRYRGRGLTLLLEILMISIPRLHKYHDSRADHATHTAIEGTGEQLISVKTYACLPLQFRGKLDRQYGHLLRFYCSSLARIRSKNRNPCYLRSLSLCHALNCT